MDESTSPRGITRRRFVGGTAVAVAASYTGFKVIPRSKGEHLPALHLSERERKSAVPSVGYVEGSDALDDLGTVPYGDARVRPAAALASGDGSFAHGLTKATILGLTPGFVDGAHPAVKAVAVDALMPHPDRRVTEPLPVFAWTLRTAPFQASNGTSYVVAMGKDPRLGFTVDVDQHDGQRYRSTSIFTPGRDTGLPRLRRGIYLLGLRPGTWAGNAALPATDAPTWADQVSLAVAIDHG